MIRVSPEYTNPTHDISLSDSVGNKVGLIITDSKGVANRQAFAVASTPRTALKTSSGNSKYSDYEPPWTPIAQDDWSGGRAVDSYDSDITRFYDSWRVNSMFSNKLMLCPQSNLATGLRSHNYNMPGSVLWKPILTGNQAYLAYKFTPAGNYTATRISVLIRMVGTPTAALTLAIRTDDSNKPSSTVLDSGTVTTASVTDVQSFWADVAISEALTGSTVYWLVVNTSGVATDDDANHWEVAVNNAAGSTKDSSDGATWADSAIDMYMRVTAADAQTKTMFFQYKYLQYCARGASVYYNGDRGVADSNSGALTTLVDASKSWTADEWIGCKVMITGGLGIAEPQNWRTITDNDGTTLTVDTAWTITQDTTTEYVILGSNKWTALGSTGITAVTDVLVVNDIMYFAQGDGVAIRRARWYNNSGTATYQYADDSTNKAKLLKTVRDTTVGLVIWRANDSPTVSVSYSAIKAWGADLAFGTTEGTDLCTFQDSWGRINGLIEYGDEDKYLWVFREGTIYAILSGVADEIPLSEIHSVMQTENGVASLTHNAYLYFSLGAMLEYYYQRQLIDIGCNKDEGLPSNRQGNITSLVGYPGRFFAGIKATSGYSSVLAFNGIGWHEVWRSPYTGQDLTGMQFQTVPGTSLDRLWIACGNDIYWVGFPSNTIDPTKDSVYQYCHEGSIESGWIYAGMVDVWKFFRSIKLFAENLVADTAWIEIDYKYDDKTTWYSLANEYNLSPVQENNIIETGGVSAKRFKYRLRLYTTSNTVSPVVKSIVLECISRIPIKYSYAFNTRLTDKDVNLNGEMEEETAFARKTQLDTWAKNVTPLTMKSVFEPYNDIVVWIDPPSIQPYKDVAEGYIARITALEC